MDIQESLISTFYSLSSATNDSVGNGEEQKWFLEEIYHTHSRETDYWLGTYGSEKRVWLGDHMTLEEAMEEAMARAEE